MQNKNRQSQETNTTATLSQNWNQMRKSCSKIKTVVIIQPQKIIKKKPFSKTLTESLKTALSTLSEKLTLSYQESELLKPPTLKENAKVQFQFKDNNEQRTAVRSGKTIGKYSKERNSKFIDDSVRPIDFEGNVIIYT